MENTTPRSGFESAGQALGMIRSAMKYLADADYLQLPVEVQAQVLREMEALSAGQAAVRGRAGWAFTATRGFDDYAQKNLGRWYITQTGVTRAAGYAHRAWARRYEQHPAVIAALGELDVISESLARQVATWTAKLPAEYVNQADELLIQAARQGVDEQGLARIAAELRSRLCGPDSDKDPVKDRGVSVETTIDGAGVISGDLTPACAAKVTAVLGALAEPLGPDDLRSHGERMHDALETAMDRLLAARLLPQRAGLPVTAVVHIDFRDLRAMPGASTVEQLWVNELRARWAAERAGAHVQPGDGGAWLDGDEAARVAADAMIVPVVLGTVDITILDDLTATAARCNQLQQELAAADSETTAGSETAAAPQADLAAELEKLRTQLIGHAIALVSGPGGLASVLRTGLLGRPLAGRSLPLDLGDTDRIPPHLRRAITVRDRHCAFPGGCDQPAAHCEPHHLRPRADHGPTSLYNLGLFCGYHHHVVVHEWGWTLTLRPDGSYIARKPDGTLFAPRPPPSRHG
jgi:hypothetical protein